MSDDGEQPPLENTPLTDKPAQAAQQRKYDRGQSSRALRLRRWDVETDLRHLKTTMGMEILHCKTVEGVRKELWVFLLIYNLVRVVMLAAAKRQKVSVSRISFASALHWMRSAKDGDTLVRLAVVPHRPNRMEPRVVKRRPKEYDRMVRPRKKMKEELRAKIGVLSSS